MKSFNILLLTLSLGASLFSKNVIAQNTHVKFSREEPISDGTNGKSFEHQYTEDVDFVYSRSLKGRDFKTMVIAKVSKANGRTIWEKTLPVEAYNKSENSYFSDLEKVSDGFILFVKKEDSKLKESYLTAQKLDENFKLIGEEKKVATSKAMDKGNSMYFYIVTHVKNYFMFRGEYQGFAHDYKNEPYKFTVVDEKLTPVWEEEAILPKDKYYSLSSSTLDEKANLVALFLVSTNGKKIGDDNATVDHVVNYYSAKDAKLKANSVSLGGQFKYYSNLNIEVDTTQNKIVLSGSYHRTKQYDGIEGVFVSQFDLNELKTIPTKLFPFSSKMIEEIIGVNDAKKGRLPKDLVIRHAFISPSGGITFVIEEHSVYISQGSSATMARPRYIYNKVVIIKTDENEIAWYKVIPKKSDAYDAIKDYFSLHTFEYNNIVYIVFNVNEFCLIHPEKTEGYSIYNNTKDEVNLLMIQGYDAKGNLVELNTFTPGKDLHMTCNINSIKKLEPNKLGLTFERVNRSAKTIAKIEAALDVE